MRISNALWGVLMMFGLMSGCASTTKIQSVESKYYIRDQRDGQRYEVAKLLGVWWMVDNFHMALPEAVAYKNHREEGAKLGWAYPYKAIEKNAPKGWRLPTAKELSDLFLQYGKVSYSGELPVYRNLFGPYDPELTQETYKALIQDKQLKLPEDPYDLYDMESSSKDFRTMLWSSDEVGERVYAVFWDKSRGVHFSSYPENFYGFCRYVKDDKNPFIERKANRRLKKRRKKQEKEEKWNKYQFE